ncbi:MAG TPA: competence/damage-inducible protein A [Flavobacteriaceae bacterium]|nr:competence/damage-inducible protein A [Flavobacteriaceae bacterium]
MFAEIITIGDEILIGQVVDTNAAFIAAELNKIGFSIYQISSVQDEKEHILNILGAAQKRAELVIITGGLGPTKDDITKEVLSEFVEDQLVSNSEVEENIKRLFKEFNLNLPLPANLRQAMVPSKATILMNKNGTAPGMWMEKDGVVFIALPGVPYEMKHLLTEEVIPRVAEKFTRPYIYHSTLVTYGLGESAVAERIKEFEENLAKHVKLAYLPSLGKVRLRLSSVGADKESVTAEVDAAMKKLQGLLSDIVVGLEEESSIIERIGKILKSQKMFLSTAESCTGGKIAAEITKFPGASSTFKGGITAYETSLKTKLLGLPKKLIDTYNVVSLEVAEAMAVRSCRVFDSDFAVATTGIAGPDKGEGDDEVGTVCIAVATPKGVVSEKFHFGKGRDRVIEKSVNKAFEMLLKEILKI